MCVWIVLIKLIFEESYRVHYLCTVLFYSCKKLADSKETEFVSPSLLNMNSYISRATNWQPIFLTKLKRMWFYK